MFVERGPHMTAYITTTDNPYNPKTQFDSWYAFDMQMGYNTCGYLDRIANPTGLFGLADYEEDIEQAIDEIVGYNFIGKYKKVLIDDEGNMTDAPPGGSPV